MKKVSLITTIIVMVCAWFATTSYGDEVVWQHKIEDALAMANQGNKAVLVDFTGSDWCGWCIKLREEVTSKPEWVEAATKDFVLCEIDLKRKTPMPEDEKAYVDAMIRKYQIQSFPSLLILDPKGAPMAHVETSYKDGVQGVLSIMQEALKSGRENQEKINKSIAVLKGEGTSEQKLAAAQDFLESSGEFTGFYSEIVDSLVGLDPENKNQILEKVYFMQLDQMDMQSPEGLDAVEPLARKLAALPNVSDATKQSANVYLAISLHAAGDKEGAMAAAKQGEGLAEFKGRPFNYAKFMEFIGK